MVKFRNTFSFFFFYLILMCYPFQIRATYESDYTSSLSYELIKYHIKVNIPKTYDKFEITAECILTGNKKVFPDTVKMILGERSTGVKPEIIEVNSKRKRNLDYLWKEPHLRVLIPEKLKKPGKFELQIKYELKKDSTYYNDRYSPFAFEISDSLCHINAAITRNDNWYPKIEGTLYKRLPDFNLSINLPKHLEVMASGQLIETEINTNRKIYHWENYPEITDRSLYFFASRTSKRIKEYSDGFRIILYLPENTLQESIDEVTGIIHRSYRFFESRFGIVPGNEYKVMAFPYGFSGLYRSMTIPASLFSDKIKNSDIFYPSRSIIHEVSHTWWGNKISANTQEDYWLFEGFAKYSEIIGIKPAGGPDIENLSFSRLKLSTLPYLDKVPPICNSGKEENRMLQRVSSYYMGATFLKLLEYTLGKKKFFNSMKEYADKFSGKCIDTDVFIDFMKSYLQESEQNLPGKYLKNPGYSRYRIKKIYDDGMLNGFLIINTGDKPVLSPYIIKNNEKEKSGRIFIPVGDEKIIKNKDKSTGDSLTFKIDPLNIFPVVREDFCGAGGMLYRNPEGRIIFINVVEGSPLSDAGVKDGMFLLDVEGENLKNKHLEELNKIFQRTCGKSLNLRIQDIDKDTLEVVVKY